MNKLRFLLTCLAHGRQLPPEVLRVLKGMFPPDSPWYELVEKQEMMIHNDKE